jgi:hypothetical protein
VAAEVGTITPPIGLNGFIVARYANTLVSNVFVGHLAARPRASRRHRDPGRFPVDHPVGSIADVRTDADSGHKAGRYFSAVHSHYLRPSVVNAGLDPDNLPAVTRMR